MVILIRNDLATRLHIFHFNFIKTHTDHFIYCGNDSTGEPPFGPRGFTFTVDIGVWTPAENIHTHTHTQIHKTTTTKTNNKKEEEKKQPFNENPFDSHQHGSNMVAWCAKSHKYEQTSPN